MFVSTTMTTHSYPFRSDKGLILERSTYQIFHGGDLTFISSTKQTSIKNGMSFLCLHLVSDLYLWYMLWRQALLIEFVGEGRWARRYHFKGNPFPAHWLPCFFPTGKKGFGKRETVLFILFFPLIYFLQIMHTNVWSTFQGFLSPLPGITIFTLV